MCLFIQLTNTSSNKSEKKLTKHILDFRSISNNRYPMQNVYTHTLFFACVQYPSMYIHMKRARIDQTNIGRPQSYDVIHAIIISRSHVSVESISR